MVTFDTLAGATKTGDVSIAKKTKAGTAKLWSRGADLQSMFDNRRDVSYHERGVCFAQTLYIANFLSTASASDLLCYCSNRSNQKRIGTLPGLSPGIASVLYLFSSETSSIVDD